MCVRSASRENYYDSKRVGQFSLVEVQSPIQGQSQLFSWVITTASITSATIMTTTAATTAATTTSATTTSATTTTS